MSSVARGFLDWASRGVENTLLVASGSLSHASSLACVAVVILAQIAP